MEQIVLITHLVLSLGIIGLIMLQQGKGADVGASFGAGASQTLFGADGGGNVLTRATAWLVALFFATSFGLALIVNQKSSVVDDLDLAIPEAAVLQDVAPAVDDELPQVDTVVPAASDAGGDDLPKLD
ncbi:preprotein translocase subunit SecG [Candidatus Marimicrobium litorale]|uniref:Protein-export membrane protein SecG n=1 Tax=Candidatus Marimicrobium litorale TaxID=2518991 RepID=A0ABT3T8B8_9GAMM|nr:preprotein translocase subunit SecG [Candidatus Marimicrobium litorale]MCX2977732.1 preprotein translocase subunit SecG [Candidatus Marimicrobium litorale]